jgi:hypothetical protein
MKNVPDFHMIVLTKRLRVQGVLDTMADQAPEIRKSLAELADDLRRELANLDGEGWQVTSHAMTIYNGLIVASFYLTR